MAESFGVDPARYDRARPRYPDALIAAIRPRLGTDVLDVGAGTGIVARQLRAAGCHVLGVEVDARMADYARTRGLEVEVSAFETWDAGGRTFDAIVAGQAWHWVDPVTGAAKAARALRPSGLLAAFWNVAQPPPALTQAFAEVYQRVLPDSLAARQWAPTPSAADAYAPVLVRVADGIRQVEAFGEPVESRFAWERHYTKEEWLDQIPTTGVHTRLPAETLAEVLAGCSAAIDAAGGLVPIRYTTLLLTTTLTGSQ